MKLALRASRLILVLGALVAPLQTTAGDLDSFIDEINVHAEADLGLFKADLHATFGVSDAKIDGILKVTTEPGDVYMVLRLGQLADCPIDQVLAEYRTRRGQGWGSIAKSLGIKPGSPEFHALKQNKLPDHAKAGSASKGKGKGKS